MKWIRSKTLKLRILHGPLLCVFIFIEILFSICFSNLVHCAPSEPARIQPPRYLYHWTNTNGLRALAQSIRKNGKLKFDYRHKYPAGEYADTPLAYESLPFLREGNALYTWTNPITALGLSEGEVYAGDKSLDSSNRTAKLVVLKISSQAKISLIDSRTHTIKSYVRFDDKGSEIIEDSGPFKGGWKMFYPPEVDPQKNDIYVYENWLQPKKGKVFRYFQEWIIWNPDVVEEITADPRLVRELITGELKRLERGEIATAEIYGGEHNRIFNSAKGREAVQKLLKTTLQNAGRGIPPELSDSSVIKICRQVFAK